MRKIKPYTYGLKNKRKPVWRREAPRTGGRFFGAVRITAAVICALLSVTYIVTMISGIVNFGNLFGLAFCLTVILLVVLYPLAKNYDTAKAIFRILGALVTVFVLYTAVVSGFMINGILNAPPASVTAASEDGKPTYTMIVLGCQTIDGKPSAMLQCRLDRAIKLEREHPDCAIILCGGKGGDETEPESVSMRRYLVEKGIDQQKLYVEAKSLDTTANIKNAKAVIEKKELPENIVIVSEFYHVYRAQRLARLEGLKNHYAACSVVQFQYSFTIPTYWIREILAISRDYAVSVLDLFR